MEFFQIRRGVNPMQKNLILLLAVLLAACSSAPAATQPPAPVADQPTSTRIVIVQTVVVEATQAPTDVPGARPIPPTAQPPVVVTVVVQPIEQAQAVQPTQASGNAPILIDEALGRGVFTNLSMSGNAFTLRCTPREIGFSLATPNTDIQDVVFYYRIVDLKRQYPSQWKAFGKMTANGNGNFSLSKVRMSIPISALTVRGLIFNLSA
jgi:hypothetical protein